MNDGRLTDAQIASALRRHFPSAGQSGLGERTARSVETTRQRQPLPGVLGLFVDADPVARRRSLLIAAALLFALTLAVAVGVGAFRESTPNGVSLRA